MRALLEKLTIPATVIFILFFVKILNPVFYDPDFYWHLKTGEYIVSHRSIPDFDPFSYTFAGKPWVAHEWLSEVIFYYVAHFFNLTGIKVLVASLFCATFVILFRFAKLMIKNDIRALIICLTFFAPLMPYASPRPQVFTFLLFSILLCILLEFKYFGNTRKLIAIPFLMPLWVNLHGAYIVGFVLLMMFLGAEFIKHLCTGKKNVFIRGNLRRLALIIFAAAITANINPHFLEAWTYPLYLMSLEVSKGVIAEWRSPDFHLIYYKYFLVLIIGYFLALAYCRKKPDLTELAIPIFFICTGMVSQRHLPLTCLALLLSFSVLYQHLDFPTDWIKLFNAKISTSNPATAQLNNSTISFLNLILVSVVAITSLYTEASGKNEKVINSMLPVKATDYIIDNHINGNMLNDYGFGGYLIYRLAPGRKIFIDGRADMYGDAFVSDYLEIYNGGENWKKKFDSFSIDYIICTKMAPIRQLLLTEESFKEVFSDEFHSVLVRTSIKENGLSVADTQKSRKTLQ